MRSAKVAVITRTKDRPTFLRRAIESVHAQTETDFVHVIYNDNGDASSIEALIDSFGHAVRDKVFLIHGEGSNGKEDSLFNPAIQAVDSKYVSLHDDDDSWHPEFLKRTIDCLESTGSGGVVVRTDKVTEEIDGDRINRLKVEHWMPDLKAINLYRQCTENQMTSITFLYRRDVYNKIGGYDDNLAVCGDWDFGIRFLLDSDVEYLDPGFALAFYHHRKFIKNAEGNTSGAGNSRFVYYTNYLLNKYLREELNEGRFGVGYIMSAYRFNQSYASRIAHRMMPGVLARKLKRRAQG